MVRKLPIDYNHNIPLGAISTDPYNYLIFEELFEDFRIFTEVKQDWLLELPLKSKVSWLGSAKQYGSSIGKLLQSKRFIEIFKNDRNRKFVMYEPIDPPYKINPLAYLMNSPTIAHAYENKRYFRDEFDDLISIPEYEIYYINELDKAASYKDLHQKYGVFMLQDEESSGSKGTYRISSADDYIEAIKALKKYSRGRNIVVSKFIKGQPASIQVCITKHGIFSSGIHKQLIDSKYLSNGRLDGANRWNGGEVEADYPDFVHHQTQEMASIVGSELASHGYKGVFGMDLIITPSSEVYAIEINARLTGYSHIITDMQIQQGKIPFMLLHVLELGNYTYNVSDPEALPSRSSYSKPVSLLIMNNPMDGELTMPTDIKPGMYKQVGDKIEFVKPAFTIESLKGEDTMLIFCRHTKGDGIERGKRILKVIKLGKTMDRTGDLNTKALSTVKAIKKTFKLPD